MIGCVAQHLVVKFGTFLKSRRPSRDDDDQPVVVSFVFTDGHKSLDCVWAWYCTQNTLSNVFLKLIDSSTTPPDGAKKW